MYGLKYSHSHTCTVFSLRLFYFVFSFFKGSVTPISEQELQVVTKNVSDVGRNQLVVFAVTVPPKFGRLVRRMPDNSFRNISTFTQSMVRMHDTYVLTC